ncbi:MAG: universal stress protein [Rhodospirillaceae bacterium]|nr:universal stress protein [Rhodospirillaceae bacterium]MBT3492308.1 universal stress protein [Rhodospirillaceae bacterium]MBT3782349.1 universal stress protein [Rhodospirillaceae bacterium]MBT3975163.1 universal stress protein [Rhodospirillaceae bacterium]MBT4166845.1 universal stress protein [Rhodospirillaceae bacterium]
MSYKRIMVPLNGMDDAGQALRLAFDLGQRFEAEVIGLHAATETSSALPYMGESMSGALLDNMVAALEKESAARQQAAQAALDEARQAVSGNGQLMVRKGAEDDMLAQYGRLADLVVVARGASDTALSESPTMQAAIMNTGRPVLVAPPERAGTVARNIVVAWNGSAQAARALGAAMPLLSQADTVTLLQIDEGSGEGPPIEDAVDYLAAHGCQAKALTQPHGHGSIGDDLLLAAHNQGADLLVMGAYSHNRIRELVFGGATLEALLDATIPVLMIH